MTNSSNYCFQLDNYSSQGKQIIKNANDLRRIAKFDLYG
jgi:hypothetical protein